MPPPPGTIKHLVVLMLENRSFDHMLGPMEADDWRIEGLALPKSNAGSDGQVYWTTTGANYAGELTVDPGHDFTNVVMQMYRSDHITPGDPPMSGFAIDYASRAGSDPANVMKCFNAGSLGILGTLARQYAVCDHWFSSVPGPTLPNRAFALGATSLGRLDMVPEYFADFVTVYQRLAEAIPGQAVSSRIYYEDWTIAMTVKYLLENQGEFFGFVKDFQNDCDNGTLPSYSFIEPRYHTFDSPAGTVPPNDQHPDNNVRLGEALIYQIYSALRGSAAWTSSVFVIVYDEHGGLFDHVPPPAVISPDDLMNNAFGFGFDRLGVRVPAVVVSPYVDAGHIDSTPYDHTSLIATARKLFLGPALGDGWTNTWLTKRDRDASCFDSCLTRDAPRDDQVQFPQEHLNANDAVVAGPHPSALDQPLSDLQRLLVQQAYGLEQTLPPALRSGKTPADIQNQHDAAVYVQSVSAALRAARVGP